MALKPRAVVGIANLAKSSFMDEIKSLSITDPPDHSGDYAISISGGHLQPVSISFDPQSTTFNGNSVTTQAKISTKLQYSNWHEVDSYMYPKVGRVVYNQFDSDEFIITFDPLVLSMTLKVTLGDGNELVASVTDSHAVDKSTNFHFTLPNQSGLTTTWFSCLTDAVKDQITKQISTSADKIASGAGKSLGAVLSSIPSSGHLTDDILFDFHGTPNGLAFPDNKGAQYRVRGELSYKGTKAPGKIGTVPFPDVPTDHDAVFNVNNYEFNALLWALYQDGQLHTTINKTNTTFQPALNTDYYNDDDAQALYKAFPNRNLIIEINLTEAPTVVLKEGTATIQYTGTMTWWIAKVGSETEKDVQAFTLSLTDMDNLDHFKVGTNSNSSKHIQVVRFSVQQVMECDVKLKSSNVPGLKGDFHSTWKHVFQPQYAFILNGAAQKGVALPSTLQEIFTNYQIDIHTGYASAAVNFTSLKKYNAVLKKRLGYELGPQTVGHINLRNM